MLCRSVLDPEGLCKKSRDILQLQQMPSVSDECLQRSNHLRENHPSPGGDIDHGLQQEDEDEDGVRIQVWKYLKAGTHRMEDEHHCGPAF